MSEEMECMCLNCGISHYIDRDSLTLEDLDNDEIKLVKNLFCSECSGVLALICKAGDEPNYKLK